MHSFIVFYSSQGINKGIREWGKIMQRSFNRTNEYRLNDLSINYLGYYCYNTLPGLNYEDAMIEMAEQINIPYHYSKTSLMWAPSGLAKSAHFTGVPIIGRF